MYRVLYASSQRLGCYLETLARFRIDPTLYAELSQIAGEDDFIPIGRVPLSWAEPRMLGSAEHQGGYADLYDDEWIGLVGPELASDLVALGVTDVSGLRRSTSRALTQKVSRLVFRYGFDGICYRSKYDQDIVNWALFEPFRISRGPATRIDLDDPDLRNALAIHHLQIGS